MGSKENRQLFWNSSSVTLRANMILQVLALQAIMVSVKLCMNVNVTVLNAPHYAQRIMKGKNHHADSHNEITILYS